MYIDNHISALDYPDQTREYLDSEYEKVKEKKFLVLNYVFADIGQEKMIFPEEDLSSFQGWINGSESAFMDKGRYASKKEVMTYLALYANDKK